jgi:hypothetical protein
LSFHLLNLSSSALFSWNLLLEIGLAAGIFSYLFFRRRPGSPLRGGTQRIEIKLSGRLEPAEVHVRAGTPAQLLIHRFEEDPQDELFEIEELNIYEMLPALHTTIIAFQAQRRGKFKMLLGGEREAGLIIVD